MNSRYIDPTLSDWVAAFGALCFAVLVTFAIIWLIERTWEK